MRRKLNSFELEIMEYWLDMDNDFKEKALSLKPEFEKRLGRKLEDFEVVFIYVNSGLERVIKEKESRLK
jgi:hypothetical protein